VRRAPIRLRLTAWYVVVIAAVLAALIAFVVTRLKSDLTSELDRSLRAAAQQIALGYSAEGPAEFLDTAQTVLPGSRSERSGAQLLDPNGRVLLTQGDAVPRRALIDAVARTQALSGRTVVRSQHVDAPREHLRILAREVRRGRRHEVVVVAESLREVDLAASRVLVLLLVGSAAALLVITCGGWWLARKALRPVERMTRRADEIGLDDLRQRITVPRVHDELGHLARTLNAMLDRLERGVDARQRLVADASHELRAPLAAMRTELDVSLRHDTLGDEARAVLASARDDVARMSRIVDNLLTLAHVDEGQLALVMQPHDLHAVADAVARAHRAAAEAAGVDVTVEGDPLLIDGDRDRLDQVLSNLVHNAIRHTPQGGHVRICLWDDHSEAGFTVSDTGPGVPPDAREHIFERFVRQDPARGRDGGAGLGLAICKEIVHAHHGRIWMRGHEPHGSAFVVALPHSHATPSRPAPHHHADRTVA
jgi:heavy metal sensor kinase